MQERAFMNISEISRRHGDFCERYRFSILKDRLKVLRPKLEEFVIEERFGFLVRKLDFLKSL